MSQDRSNEMAGKPDSISEFIHLIAAELRRLADEVEELPSFENGQLSSEQIVQLQKIDLCSQKLKDFAALADKIASQGSLKALKPEANIGDVVKLEYTKALL